MNLRLAIFDLDGVIVSTDMFHFEAWKRLFSSDGALFTHLQRKNLPKA